MAIQENLIIGNWYILNVIKIKKDALGREKFLKGGSGKKYLRKQLKNYLRENNINI